MVKAEVPGQRRALALVPRPLYPSPPGPWPCYGSHRASPPQALGLSSCTPLYIWHYLPSPCHRTTLRATTRHALHRHINTIVDPPPSLKSSHIPKGAPEIILGETTQKSFRKSTSPPSEATRPTAGAQVPCQRVRNSVRFPTTKRRSVLCKPCSLISTNYSNSRLEGRCRPGAPPGLPPSPFDHRVRCPSHSLRIHFWLHYTMLPPPSITPNTLWASLSALSHTRSHANTLTTTLALTKPVLTTTLSPTFPSLTIFQSFSQL